MSDDPDPQRSALGMGRIYHLAQGQLLARACVVERYKRVGLQQIPHLSPLRQETENDRKMEKHMTDPQKLREALEKLKNAVAKAKVTKSLHVQAEIAEVCEAADEYLGALTGDGERKCTCHPDDSPPVQCAGKYALTDCKQADAAGEVDVEALRIALSKEPDQWACQILSSDRGSDAEREAVAMLDNIFVAATARYNQLIESTLRPPRTEGVEPCPFCGNEPNIYAEPEHFEVVCMAFVCQVNPNIKKGTRESAIGAWNTRAPLPIAAPGEVERLKREVNHALAKPYPSINGDSIRNEVIDHLAQHGLLGGGRE